MTDWKPLFVRWPAGYLLRVSLGLVLLQVLFYLGGPPYDIRGVFNARTLLGGLATVWVWVVAHPLATKWPFLLVGGARWRMSAPGGA